MARDVVSAPLAPGWHSGTGKAVWVGEQDTGKVWMNLGGTSTITQDLIAFSQLEMLTLLGCMSTEQLAGEPFWIRGDPLIVRQPTEG